MKKATLILLVCIMMMLQVDILAFSTNIDAETKGHREEVIDKVTTCGGQFHSEEWMITGYCVYGHPCCEVKVIKFTTYKNGNVATPHKHYEYHDASNYTYYVCPYGGPVPY